MLGSGNSAVGNALKRGYTSIITCKLIKILWKKETWNFLKKSENFLKKSDLGKKSISKENLKFLKNVENFLKM